MKRVLSLTVLLLAVLSLPALGGQGKSGDKATGTVTYPNGLDISTIVFDVHEAVGDRPAKGTLQYYELDPATGTIYYYSLNISCVNVDPASHTATFAGTVYNTNLGIDGQIVQAWVYDGGKPGSDLVAGNVTLTPDCSQLDPTAAPFFNSWIAVTEGNLTVHPSK